MQAQSVVCLSNLKQWGVVISMYAEENNNSFQGGWDDIGASTEPAEIKKNYWWLNAWGNYLQDDIDKLRYCPTATKYSSSNYTYKAWRIDYGGAIEYGSYGLNAWIENPTLPATPNPAYWQKTTEFKNKHNIPLLMDSKWPDAWPSELDSPPVHDNIDIRIEPASMMARMVINRHNGYVNAVMGDFSIRKVGLKELWTLNWSKDFDAHGVYTLSGGATATLWDQQAPWMSRFKLY